MIRSLHCHCIVVQCTFAQQNWGTVLLYVKCPVSFLTLMIAGQHHYSLKRIVKHHTGQTCIQTSRATKNINQHVVPRAQNFLSPPQMPQNGHKCNKTAFVLNRMKKEPDESMKWKGSCVSTLIMIIFPIAVSARLIWEHVFSPQTDCSRDGKNPLYPAKIRSACRASTLD